VDSATVLLLASLTGANAPVACSADPTSYNPGNVTTATAFTKSWTMLPGTPSAGTVYQVTTEFTGTWQGNALAFAAGINGTWTQMNPSAGSGSFSSGATIAGWLALTVRVLSSSTARFALAGAIGETASSVTPGSGTIALAPLSQTLAVAASDTLALGYLFGASSSGQGLATYGSTFLTISS
jgi:Protein of unknown function (DUF2793)